MKSSLIAITIMLSLSTVAFSQSTIPYAQGNPFDLKNPSAKEIADSHKMFPELNAGNLLDQKTVTLLEGSGSIADSDGVTFKITGKNRLAIECFSSKQNTDYNVADGFPFTREEIASMAYKEFVVTGLGIHYVTPTEHNVLVAMLKTFDGETLNRTVSSVDLYNACVGLESTLSRAKVAFYERLAYKDAKNTSEPSYFNRRQLEPVISGTKDGQSTSHRIQ
jgi:hypothetical protein